MCHRQQQQLVRYSSVTFLVAELMQAQNVMMNHIVSMVEGAKDIAERVSPYEMATGGRGTPPIKVNLAVSPLMLSISMKQLGIKLKFQIL